MWICQCVPANCSSLREERRNSSMAPKCQPLNKILTLMLGEGSFIWLSHVWFMCHDLIMGIQYTPYALCIESSHFIKVFNAIQPPLEICSILDTPGTCWKQRNVATLNHFSPHSWDQTKAPCHSPNISGEVVISCHCFDKSELPFEAGGVFVISHVTSLALRFWVTHFVYLCICLPFILRQDQWNMLGYLKISKSGKTWKKLQSHGKCLPF